MNIPIINQHELQKGDILACVFEHPPFKEYISALITYIRLMWATDEESIRKRMQAMSLLIRGLITWFDNDTYFHTSLWDGEFVAEAGMNGVKKNPIAPYKNLETYVFRFAKDNKVVIGTPEYPTKPLIETSDAISAQNLNYAYSTAVLMMFLCFTRWKRDEWIRKMEDFIKAHLNTWQRVIVEAWFRANQRNLRKVFEKMATECMQIILKFRKEQGLICSEFVAKVYNESEPIGKYQIEKPLLFASHNEPQGELLSLAQFEEVDLSELEEELNSVDFIDVFGDEWQEEELYMLMQQGIDNLYTPSDIVHSLNTIKVAQLKVV